jgi:hypothetical protein
MVYLVIAILCISSVAIFATGSFSESKRARFNVVEIYILNWDTNVTGQGDEIDVQFRISIDSDGDGTFDIVRGSEVFRNTTVEIAPFRLGGAIPTTVGDFHFKVEALRVVDGSLVPMHFTNGGPTAVDTGINQRYSSEVWSYDATAGVGKDDLACRMSYVYYVNSVN